MGAIPVPGAIRMIGDVGGGNFRVPFLILYSTKSKKNIIRNEKVLITTNS